MCFPAVRIAIPTYLDGIVTGQATARERNTLGCQGLFQSLIQIVLIQVVCLVCVVGHAALFLVQMSYNAALLNKEKPQAFLLGV